MLTQEDPASIYDGLLMELASDVRRSILLKLNQKSKKLSQIATEENITIQEAHRNAIRLIASGLVQKNSENSLLITPYGKTIIKQISGLDFIVRHKNYFEDHNLGNLPEKFIQRLGALRNSQIVRGIGPVLERWKMMFLEAKEYMSIITSQYPVDVATVVVEKAMQGIRFSYVLGENTIVPMGRSQLLEKSSWKKLMSKGTIQRKMLQEVQVGVSVTERQACVFFPNLNGQADVTSVFFSKDPDFREWCLDFFNYQWKRADVFDETKLKET